MASKINDNALAVVESYEKLGRSASIEFLKQYGITAEEASIRECYDLLADGVPVEIKYRAAKTLKYKTLILEEIKAKNILKNYERFYYFIFRGNRNLVVYRIDHSALKNVDVRNFVCPKYSCKVSEKINKVCYDLPVERGVEFERIGGEWLKVGTSRHLIKSLKTNALQN